MATDTAPKQTDAKPAESPKDTTPAKSVTPAKSATPGKATIKPKPKPRAKTAAKSRSRKPAAARTGRSATATATPPAQAKVPNGGKQFAAGVIDAQQKSVTAIVDYQTRAAELSQIPGVTAVAQARAKVLRSVTDTYVSAARALLK